MAAQVVGQGPNVITPMEGIGVVMDGVVVGLVLFNFFIVTMQYDL
jgi:hypothetical protein